MGSVREGLDERRPGGAPWKETAMSDAVAKTDESPADVRLRSFQELIRGMYHDRDVERGIDGTFMWLMEEVGELATALREGSHADRLEEFADVLAWLTTIANVAEVDLSEAVIQKYGSGCPGCGEWVCRCSKADKP